MRRTRWRRFWALIAGLSLAVTAGAETIYEDGTRGGEAAGPVSERIDALVLAGLKERGLQPTKRCSDAVFLRRAFLTVTGTLPTEAEARAFLANEDPAKREKLIDALLNRPEYVDYWAMKWGDLLRVKAEFPIKLWPNAVQAYHRYIRESLETNKPYDQLAREMLTSNGSNFREAEVNFFRAMQDRTPKGIASTVALTFMGQRANEWPERKLEATAGFFAHVAYKPTAEWKEEIVYFDPQGDEAELWKGAILPDGTRVKLDPRREDPRKAFTDWLLRPENPYFGRAMANRIWAWLMGRGIVHEADDHRPDNPPANPALLTFLERQFADGGYDMKALFRAILNTETFQRSPVPAQADPESEVYFAHYPLRRLEAEVLIDALNQITGTTEAYSSAIPEPFTFVPEDVRSIALGDGSITSSFLELFGRPPRDTGLESERSDNTTPQQRLHLLNSSHVQNKIRRCPLVQEAGRERLEGMAETIYLTVLARFPTENEVAVLREHSEATATRGADLALDLLWALINQPEFYFNH